MNPTMTVHLGDYLAKTIEGIADHLRDHHGETVDEQDLLRAVLREGVSRLVRDPGDICHATMRAVQADRDAPAGGPAAPTPLDEDARPLRDLTVAEFARLLGVTDVEATRVAARQGREHAEAAARASIQSVQDAKAIGETIGIVHCAVRLQNAGELKAYYEMLADTFRREPSATCVVIVGWVGPDGSYSATAPKGAN